MRFGVEVMSRLLVEEKAEVFRKGTHLLTPEYLEGDYAGEVLRKEASVIHSHRSQG
jgi:hypothetical protein